MIPPVSRVVKFMETKYNGDFHGLRNGELVLKSAEVQFYKLKKF